MVTTSNHIDPYRELGSIEYWSLAGLREMGSILSHIGTSVKKAHHRRDNSVEITIYCVVDKRDPSIRKPSMTTALKLLKEFGFEVSEKTVKKKGDTMCTLIVSWPHNFISGVAPPALTTGTNPARIT
jgi:hypothetical protein